MKTLIIASQVNELRHALRGVPGPLRALVLIDGAEAAAVRGLLRAREAVELDRGALACGRRAVFRERYIAFLSAVNEANRSRFWWAMPFTTKNPLATPLCRNLFDFLLVADLVEADTAPLVVVSDQEDLAAQLRTWAAQRSVRVVGRVRRPGRRWRRAARRWLPVAFVLTALRIVRAWWRARGRRPTGTRAAVAVTTLVHGHSFPEADRYREAYFGALPDFLVARGVDALLFALVIEHPGERLIEAAARARMPLPLVPVEACLSLRELVACLAHAVVRYVKPFAVAGPSEIGGHDVRDLLERAVRAACRDGGFLMHVRLYYASRALARAVRLERVIYPYENRAFEKMLLTGFREAAPATRLVGYNHASITSSHLNFVLGAGEAKVMPLPDVILTLGPVVTEWLVSEGQYPHGLLRSACALRQGRTAARPVRSGRRPVRDVLVCLATSLREYARTLALLDAALPAETPYRLRVRPHPTLRLADGLAAAALSRTDFFEVDDQPLEESLERADVVLYASSTVGLEAVAGGIPAVYLDLQDILDTDPMPGWSELKWTVCRADELVPTLRAIEALPDGEFAERQAHGARYAARYLGPVDEAALATFLEA